MYLKTLQEDLNSVPSNLPGGSQLSLTTAPEDPVPLLGTPAFTCTYPYTDRQTHTHILTYIIKNKSFVKTQKVFKILCFPQLNHLNHYVSFLLRFYFQLWVDEGRQYAPCGCNAHRGNRGHWIPLQLELLCSYNPANSWQLNSGPLHKQHPLLTWAIMFLHEQKTMCTGRKKQTNKNNNRNTSVHNI